MITMTSYPDLIEIKGDYFFLRYYIPEDRITGSVNSSTKPKKLGNRAVNLKRYSRNLDGLAYLTEIQVSGGLYRLDFISEKRLEIKDRIVNLILTPKKSEDVISA